MKKFLSFIFSKKFWLNKWTIAILSIIVIVFGMASTYIYSPGFVPQLIKSSNKNLVDKLVGKELAEKIDETRNHNGATSIRALFNLNKEENLEKHCEKKEEKGKEQEKCYKTYKNEEFGFSVKYPVEYSLENDNQGILLYPPEKKEYTDNRTCQMDVGIWDKEKYLSIDHVMGFYRPKDNIISEDETIEESIKGFQDNIDLAGLTWKRDYHLSKTSKGNIFKQVIIATEKDNKIYAISLYSIETGDKSLLHEEDYNELLKTFSFN